MKLTLLLAVLLSVGWSAPAAEGDAPRPVPFDEVNRLIRQHLADATESELNDAAVKGLIEQLQPHVMLGTPAESLAASTNQLVAAKRRFRSDYGYLQVGVVKEGLAPALRAAIDELLKEGPLKGLVLDLRFAGGADYDAAAAAAGLFVDDERVLLQVGGKSYSVPENKEAILIPVMILINRETTGSAEALGAALKSTKAGLLIGGASAGRATLFESFPLSNGGSLSIATQPVRLADGTAIPRTGLSPDITVEVSLADERRYLEDPFWQSNLTRAARAVENRRRVTEADLVRQRREGVPLQQIIEDRSEPEAAVAVTDPVLARGLDLLKALTVVKTWNRE